MDSDSENDSMEGKVHEDQREVEEPTASWGKAKFDYYFTDYVDKDYPSGLSRKEERLAQIEQEEAQRIQKKLYSNLDNIDLQPAIGGDDSDSDAEKEDLINFIETQNKSIIESKRSLAILTTKSKKARKENNVKFDLEAVSGEEHGYISDDDEAGEDGDEDSAEDDTDEDIDKSEERKRRPINMAIRKNRGLTPYKKKEYRNPRVKHKLKYRKAMTKRRRMVKEAQTEFYRYSGETTGIKTSTVKSIKLC